MQFILPTPQHRDARALCELAREILAGLMEQEARALPTDVALRDLGVDSRTTVALIAALSTQLSRTLAPTLVYSYPTLEALAEHLATDATASDGAADPTLPAGGELPVDEPIAIVGIGCRFPGGAGDPQAYFELLRGGVDAIVDAPGPRPELRREGGELLRGGFLEDVACFDEAFFGISPREASAMDPQQRLMLEVSWEALEDAGVSPSQLVDSRTGVFVGAMWQDYAHHSAALTSSIEQHTATGLDTSVIAARISYRLGLRGPSLTVNTACSSALVAVHLACQSLRQRESTLAIAGGVNLILSAHSSIAMERFGALSPDGRCKAFDAAADGYVRGEGAGVVVLKRLADAVAANDPIYCVIRGSAINNDGASNGLAAPSERAQVQVLRDAYARARVAPSKVHYVEAHGTGTRLGDPIEAQALGEVLGHGRSADRRLRIGSVKTNLGHLEAASGIASLIKVALAMRNGYLPQSLHLVSPNPAIDFDRLGLAVQDKGSAWPRADELPLAGVSAFGFGGTNAHVVVEGALQARHELLVVAADDARTLQSYSERLIAAAQHLESSADLRALCRASALHWRHGRLRKALVLSSGEELTEQLERAPVHTVPSVPRRIAFVYSGVGSQWPGMARALLATEPVFRAAVEQCDAEIELLTGRSILAELWSADPRVIARCERYQPMIFAIQIGLGALFEAHGVVPDAIVGHSIGEVAAAHRAGILSLRDACAVICHMARLLGRAEGDGAMLMVGLGSADTHALLAELCDDGLDLPVVIAAENGPRSTVVSGTRPAVARVAARAQGRGILTVPVQSEVAFHHPMLRHALTSLPKVLATIEPQAARIAMWSTTDGVWLSGHECHGRYFQRNQLQRVRFAQAIDVLAQDGLYSFVEIGPHPLLVRELREGAGQRDSSPVVVPSMTRSDQVRSSVLDGLAALFRAGHTIEHHLAGHHPHSAEPELALPFGARRFMPLPSRDVAKIDAGGRPFTLPLAAHSEAALRRSAAELSELVARAGEAALPSLLNKLARVRTALAHRATVTATDASELRQGLTALALGDHARGLVTLEPGTRPRRSPGKLAFVFSGHGSQWAGMGQELLREEPVFAAAIEACDEAFALLGARRVRPVLEGPADAFPKRADEVQPLLFALQVALGRLWLSWGITPDVIIGHSVGEIAAAHIAGLIDVHFAARVVCERAAALVPAIGQGAMALVELPLAQAHALVDRQHARISVAVHHSQSCCVLAGERAALADVLRELDARHVFCRWVDVDYASHSPQMQPIAAELQRRLAQACRPSSTPRFAMLSTTLGRVLGAGDCGAEYWAANLARPVLFREAIEQVVGQGVTTFLELSAHPLLSNGILETAAATGGDTKATFVPSLRRSSPELHVLNEALGQLFVAGHRIDWARFHPTGDPRIALPPYPFERRRHWKSERVTREASEGDAREATQQSASSAAEPAALDDATAVREQLRAARGEARLSLLRPIVVRELAALLRTEEQRLAPRALLSELGVDSLLGLQLRSRLEARTGIALSGTRMWEDPTPEGIAERLASDA